MNGFFVVDISTWTNVTELNFGTNQLAILPEDIGVLTNLEVLILSNNALSVSCRSKHCLNVFMSSFSEIFHVVCCRFCPRPLVTYEI